MKIAILNYSGLNESHISRLNNLGEVIGNFESTSTIEELKERGKDADILVVDIWIAPINEVISDFPNLKYIVVNSTGFNALDLNKVTKLGIKASNTPNFSTDSVAELNIGLMFAVARKIVQGDNQMRQKVLEVDPGTENGNKFKGFNVAGKIMGIVGLGQIGQRVAQISKGIGMKVIAYNRSPKNIDGIKMVGLEELMKTSDVVSINLALNSETKDIINENLLKLMKPTSIIINVARGELINNTALYNVLSQKIITGAGLDVISPVDNSNKLLGLDNVVLTPHMGWDTTESIINMGEIIVENIESFINNNPKNLIN